MRLSSYKCVPALSTKFPRQARSDDRRALVPKQALYKHGGSAWNDKGILCRDGTQGAFLGLASCITDVFKNILMGPDNVDRR